MKKKRLALLVAGTLLCSALVGCTKTYATDLMDGVNEEPTTEVQVQEETWAGMYDFSVKLLQTTCDRGENTLVSPMSVLSALTMTANGARGETLAQMRTLWVGQWNSSMGRWRGWVRRTIPLCTWQTPSGLRKGEGSLPIQTSCR